MSVSLLEKQCSMHEFRGECHQGGEKLPQNVCTRNALHCKKKIGYKQFHVQVRLYV